MGACRSVNAEKRYIDDLHHQPLHVFIAKSVCCSVVEKAVNVNELVSVGRGTFSVNHLFKGERKQTWPAVRRQPATKLRMSKINSHVLFFALAYENGERVVSGKEGEGVYAQHPILRCAAVREGSPLFREATASEQGRVSDDEEAVRNDEHTKSVGETHTSRRPVHHRERSRCRWMRFCPRQCRTRHPQKQDHHHLQSD